MQSNYLKRSLAKIVMSQRIVDIFEKNFLMFLYYICYIRHRLITHLYDQHQYQC